MENIFCTELLKELEMEEGATRKCLERIPKELFEWKPHERSLKMGDLATIVADIPNWIYDILKKDEIDFMTYDSFTPKDTEDLVDHFDQSIKKAKEALKKSKDSDLEKDFSLKDSGKMLMTASKKINIGSTINHLAHHRGQLTVYMRQNDILVPSIYGPSADENVWA